MKKTFVVSADDAGVRLDKLVVRESGHGRAAVKRLFEEGAVRLASGKKVDRNAPLPVGSEVVLTLPDVDDDGPIVVEASPAIPLAVLLERDDLVVVNKPANQPTAPLRGGETGTLANALVGRWPEMQTFGFSPREPGLLHRLDNDTSGVIVACRTKLCWEALLEAMRAEGIEKKYLAIVEDEDLGDTGTIDLPLAPHPKDARRVLACVHPRDVERLNPRPARSSFEVKQRIIGLALVEISAPRALRHQIRAHLAGVGCPIVGDALYGAKRHLELGRHALHAASVAFAGDNTVRAFFAEAPLPEELAALLTPAS
jgi:23S rRNA pseudouridine1911/1915/1917 synthase